MNKRTKLQKYLIVIEMFLLPVQIALLKEIYNFDILFYFLLTFPYLIWGSIMKVQISYTSHEIAHTNENIEKVLNKIQEIENKLDKQN
jgi:hypothetical protein